MSALFLLEAFQKRTLYAKERFDATVAIMFDTLNNISTLHTKEMHALYEEYKAKLDSLLPAAVPAPLPDNFFVGEEEEEEEDESSRQVVQKRLIEDVASFSSSSSSSEDEDFEDSKKKHKEEDDDILILDDDDEEEDEEEDSFVAADHKEPVVYPAKIMDESMLKSFRIGEKRKRNKRKIWSPSDHDGERDNDRGIDLLADAKPTDVKTDARALKQLVQDIREQGPETAFKRNQWYKKRYGNALEGIINNLGSEGNNAKARELFILIIQRCMSEDEADHPYIETKKMPGSGNKICCLCNKSKNCPHTLWIMEDGDNGTSGHPIAVCCSWLARTLIEFFSNLMQLTIDRSVNGFASSFNALEKLFAAVQSAHAGKSEKKRKC